MQPDLEPRLNGALFSPCGIYRYTLTREFGGVRPLLICGLNPSTADVVMDDATIRKETGFAKLWNCGRLVKVNAYAFRATDPKVMKRASKTGIDIVGPNNDQYIQEAVDHARICDGVIVVAWGANIDPRRQAELSYVFGDDAFCLGVNKDGSPVHPLYIPYDRALARWSCP